MADNKYLRDKKAAAERHAKDKENARQKHKLLEKATEHSRPAQLYADVVKAFDEKEGTKLDSRGTDYGEELLK